MPSKQPYRKKRTIKPAYEFSGPYHESSINRYGQACLVHHVYFLSIPGRRGAIEFSKWGPRHFCIRGETDGRGGVVVHKSLRAVSQRALELLTMPARRRRGRNALCT